MEEIIINYVDLSDKKQEEIYTKVSKVVQKELKETLPEWKWKNITFGELDKLIMDKIKECKFRFVMGE